MPTKRTLAWYLMFIILGLGIGAGVASLLGCAGCADNSLPNCDEECVAPDAGHFVLVEILCPTDGSEPEVCTCKIQDQEGFQCLGS